MRKMPNKRCFRVYNKRSKRIFAKCSSKTRAIKQIKLLRNLHNNK